MTTTVPETTTDLSTLETTNETPTTEPTAGISTLTTLNDTQSPTVVLLTAISVTETTVVTTETTEQISVDNSTTCSGTILFDSSLASR